MRLRSMLLASAVALAASATVRADVIRHGIDISGGQNAFTAFSVTQAPGAEPNTVTLRVSAADARQMAGYGFVLSYDTERYAFVEGRESADSFLRPESGAAPLFLARSHEPGKVAVGAMRIDGAGATGEGSLAELTFRVLDGSERPSGSPFSLNDGVVVDLAGKADAVTATTLERAPLVPDRYDLAQNSPNPFNPTTTIAYQLPEAGRVRVAIYTSLGQELRTLVDEDQPAGSYTVRWDGRDAAGRLVASGIYFYRMDAGGFSQARRMMLLK